MRNLVKYRYLFVALILIAATLLADVVSKQLVHEHIAYGDRFPVIPYLIGFGHVHNTGAAFSFGADNPNAIYVFIALTFVCLLVLGFAIYRWGTRSRLLLVAISLIFSGALGNWIDRVRMGEVEDFLYFDFWKSFPTFNIADSCICIGAVLFIVYILFFEEKAAKRAQAAKNAAQGDSGEVPAVPERNPEAERAAAAEETGGGRTGEPVPGGQETPDGREKPGSAGGRTE